MSKQFKIILGIESSCDETSAAVLREEDGRIQILSNIVSSSLELHAKYGGVIPEQAAREQLKLIIPVIKEALRQAQCKPADLDAIAVTYGPGLIGSLLVGVETAKVLSKIWNKPLIPVNHLIGHFYANWIDQGNASTPLSNNSSLSEAQRNRSDTTTPQFPCIGLLVSGGHSDLVLFKNHGQFEYIGGTRDDAAGECFDKCARVLGFAYPGGPKISKLAQGAKKSKLSLPKPMADSKDLDFSFSGLKTAFSNLVNNNFQLDKGYYDKESETWQQTPLEEQLSADQLEDIRSLCAELENTIVEALIDKTIQAIQQYNVEQLIVAGGVAANQKLREELEKVLGVQAREAQYVVPPPSLCTDNAAMIAAAAFYIKPVKDPLEIQADPNLSLAY